MLRANRSALRQVKQAAGSLKATRSVTTKTPPSGNTAASSAPNATGSSVPSGASAAPGAKPTPLPASSSSEGGSVVPKLLLLTALTAPAGVAVYVKQNPQWNPEIVRDNENWIKFRELVLGKEKPAPKAAPTVVKKPAAPVVAKSMKPTPAPKEPTKSADELSAVISKGQQKETKKEAKKPAEKSLHYEDENPKKAEAKATKPKEAPVVKDKAEKKTVVTEKKAVSAEKPAAPVQKKAAGEPVAKKKAEPVVPEKTLAEKKVDEANAKERAEIAKLTSAASTVVLSDKVGQQIQSTTKEIVDTLQAETSVAALDIDKNYLSGIHELDSNSLAIRVAQLATEMKHRSKWEAVRLLEALRRMEEDAQKKTTEVLRRQESLHAEVLAREVRLQEELLTRAHREELAKLKKEYAEELARTVNQQRTATLTKLQKIFESEKKAIENRYHQQLKAKSEELQQTLTKERKQRVAELENYRAQLRALNAVLDTTSTYEAFSHQVHKTSVAALALSNRIEAAAPLQAEVKALREAGRNDPLIEAAIDSIPQNVIEEGAPSVAQLQDRFKVVNKVGRRAALVPENSGLAGQIFGGALSYLMIPPGGPIEGNDTDAILSRADYALKAGDIEKAVAEMKSLSGLPAQVSQDWIVAAESRLAVEQTVQVVKAHISLLAASCS